MATKPHLTQIQSSNSTKYPTLYEEIEDIGTIIGELTDLSFEAVVDSYADLLLIEPKTQGFYLVNSDETYRNNPTHYYYDGESFKMVGDRLPEGLLKKTVVFYIKRLSEIGQNIQLYVPYKGYISLITARIPEVATVLKVGLYNGEQLLEVIDFQGLNFMQSVVYHSVDNPVLITKILEGNTGIENININVDIVVEE